MRRYTSFLILFVFALTACTPPANKTQELADELRGTKWEILKYPLDVTLNFNQELDKVAGNTGCNNYNADFLVKNYEIEFSSFIQTERACDIKMDMEREYLVRLSDVVKFGFQSDNLVLTDRANRILLSFKRAN